MAFLKTNITEFLRALRIFVSDFDGDVWIRIDRFSLLIEAPSHRRIEIERSLFDEYEITDDEFYTVDFKVATFNSITADTTDIRLTIGSNLKIEVGTAEEETIIEMPRGTEKRLRDDDYLCYYAGDISFLRGMTHTPKIMIQWMPTEIRVLCETKLVCLCHTTAKHYEDDSVKPRILRIISAEYPQGPPKTVLKGLCCGYTMTAGFRIIPPTSYKLISAICDLHYDDNLIECDTDKPLHIRSSNNHIAIDVFINWKE